MLCALWAHASCPMSTLVHASRFRSAQASKAAQSITESASLLRWWHKFQLTSSFSFARAPISTGISLAKQLCHSSAFRYVAEAQHVRSCAQSLLNSSKTCQGLGFAAQTEAASADTFISLYTGAGCLLSVILSMQCWSTSLMLSNTPETAFCRSGKR